MTLVAPDAVQIIFHADARTLNVDWFANFDLLYCDPPYSRHVHENATSCAATGGISRGVRERDFGFQYLTPELRRVIARAAARVRRWSLVYSDVESAHLWRKAVEAAGAEYVRTLHWIRWSQAQLSGDRPASCVEALTLAHRADYETRTGKLRVRSKPVTKEWQGPGNLMAFTHACLRGDDKHPTEKPLDQALDVVCFFSSPGDRVLDLCGGSGVTAIACLLLGRSCACVEAKEEHATAAAKRLDDAKQGKFSKRDLERIARWVEISYAVDSKIERNEKLAACGKYDGTWERAQLRLAEVNALVERMTA